jgi:hypothetical protein
MLDVKSRSARAINTREPIKEPETHRSGEVEDHLSDHGMELMLSYFCHGSP